MSDTKPLHAHAGCDDDALKVQGATLTYSADGGGDNGRRRRRAQLGRRVTYRGVRDTLGPRARLGPADRLRLPTRPCRDGANVQRAR